MTYLFFGGNITRKFSVLYQRPKSLSTKIDFNFQINFEYPPSVTVNESSSTVVNLKQCDPDIRYMGVVQRVEFYPLLLIKRSPNIAFEPLYADRRNNGKCLANH